jgi:hypothetical protein
MIVNLDKNVIDFKNRYNINKNESTQTFKPSFNNKVDYLQDNCSSAGKVLVNICNSEMKSIFSKYINKVNINKYCPYLLLQKRELCVLEKLI